MNIGGYIEVNIRIGKIDIRHSMQVLNSKTYRTVLLGRDFLSCFSAVHFDFRKNRVKLGFKMAQVCENSQKQLRKAA